MRGGFGCGLARLASWDRYVSGFPQKTSPRRSTDRRMGTDIIPTGTLTHSTHTTVATTVADHSEGDPNQRKPIGMWTIWVRATWVLHFVQPTGFSRGRPKWGFF